MNGVNRNRLDGAVVTITGGTGSFGKTMARHLLSNGIEQVNIFSRDEAKQDEMRRHTSKRVLAFIRSTVHSHNARLGLRAW